jgi:hypothetical protein
MQTQNNYAFVYYAEQPEMPKYLQQLVCCVINNYIRRPTVIAVDATQPSA